MTMKLEIMSTPTRLKDLQPGDCFMKDLNSEDVFMVSFDEATGKREPFWNHKDSGVWAVNLKTGGHACYGQVDMKVHAVDPTLQVNLSREFGSA